MGKEVNINGDVIKEIFTMDEYVDFFKNILENLSDDNVFKIPKRSKKLKNIVDILLKNGYAELKEGNLILSKDIAYISYDSVINWLK